MKRIFLAVAAAIGLAATAKADFGGESPAAPPPQMPGMYGAGGYGQPPAPAPDKYGLNPILRRVVWWKKDFGGCSNCGTPGHATVGNPAPYGAGMPYGAGVPYGGGMPPGAGMPGMMGGAPGMPGMGGTMPGTLVFPNHWYSRSPRDYFMMEPGR
jgi:hypothetical protein